MGETRNDPVEKIIAEALDEVGIESCGERSPRGVRLDFYLPEYDLHIECKHLHSDRISEQMSRTENVIAVQGMRSAEWLAALIRNAEVLPLLKGGD